MRVSVSKEEVIEGLKCAKERLRGHWGRGWYFMDNVGTRIYEATEDCRCCAIGAVRIAVRKYDPCDRTKLRQEIESVLQDSLPCGERNVPFYNDQPGRTEEEVLALFDRAIAKLEAT